MSGTRSLEYIQYIAKTYRNDLYGYRRDILGRKHADWQKLVGESVQVNKRTSVSSAHGVGKTGFAADVIHWFLATRPRPAIVCTANTEDQLNKKLWRELSKVNQTAKNADWFDWKSSTFTRFNDPTAQAVAQTWSVSNPGAFAGTHEDDVLGLFDEGAEIDDAIYQVFNGAMTTAGARWLILGNPRRSEGFFYEATHGDMVARRPGDLAAGLWQTFTIKASDSPFVAPDYETTMERICKGRDTDNFRVQVLGLPPRFDENQFVPRAHVTAALSRTVEIFPRWPLVLGVDVGHRHDKSVIVPRRGRKVLDAVVEYFGQRTTDFARRIADEISFYREEHGLEAQVVIEDIGMGVGVVETLQDMGYSDQVWPVNTGNPAYEKEVYSNLRCEMWATMKAWLEGDVEIPNHQDLVKEITAVRRKPGGSTNKLVLETKDEMRRRGQNSPDFADALALTFAVPFDLLPDRKRDIYDDYREPAMAGTWMGV